MQLNSYLHFNGNCEEAFKFYEKCLGGKIVMMMKYEGAPGTDQTPAEWRNKIMHARMTVGEHTLMASDAPPGRFSQPQGFSINISVTDPVEADRIFNALSDKGSITMPIAETFWAKRFGMFTDRFGIPWMVDCEKAM